MTSGRRAALLRAAALALLTGPRSRYIIRCFLVYLPIRARLFKARLIPEKQIDSLYFLGL